jgi:hypothetical protein
MSNNEYGLDVDYMSNKLTLMERDIDRYTPDEAFNELTRMAGVAANQAGHKVTIKVNITLKITAER